MCVSNIKEDHSYKLHTNYNIQQYSLNSFLPSVPFLPPSLPSPHPSALPSFSPVAVADFHQAQLLHDRHAVRHTPKDGVFSVQPGRGGEGEEELTAVCVGTGVGLSSRGREGRRIRIGRRTVKNSGHGKLGP